MEYRRLGRAGVKVSTIGLGTNRFGSEKVPQESVDRIIALAQEMGINFIDTADTYINGNSEQSLGRALQGRWDQFVVATKFTHPVGEGVNDRGASRYHLQNAVEASLRRLKSEHIDLLYVHTWDPETPIAETLRGLDDLIRAGKIRYIGASNFTAWQLAEANLIAEMRGWSAFVALQSHYHLLERQVEHEELAYCQTHQVGFVPYFPLAGGFLTGKYHRNEPPPAGSRGETSPYVQEYMTPKNYDKIETLSKWAESRGHSLTELAHAWLLAQPAVCSVISGATRPEQVVDHAKAAGWSLSATEVENINAIVEGKNQTAS